MQTTAQRRIVVLGSLNLDLVLGVSRMPLAGRDDGERP